MAPLAVCDECMGVGWVKGRYQEYFPADRFPTPTPIPAYAGGVKYGWVPCDRCRQTGILEKKFFGVLERPPSMFSNAPEKPKTQDSTSKEDDDGY